MLAETLNVGAWFSTMPSVDGILVSITVLMCQSDGREEDSHYTGILNLNHREKSENAHCCTS